MSLWKIALRSIQQRGLSSALTGLSMALGVALVICVLVIHSVVQDSFSRGAEGYHLIVGKKGSQLQLVMNTVYHLQESMEPVPYTYYKEFLNVDGKRGRYAGYVKVAIPYCLGDNYEGFHVVGTTPAMFTELQYYGGQHYEFADGRNFETEHPFEAVVGAAVARATGLKVGDKFQPTHSVPGEESHDHDPFTVVGVLAATGTPNDRALFINIEGFYMTSDHRKPLEEVAQLEADKARLSGGKSDDHDHAHDDHKHDDHAHPPTKQESTSAKQPAADNHDHDHDDHAHAEQGTSKDGPAHDDHAHEKHDHAATKGHDHSGHDHSGHDHGHDHGHHHEPVPEAQREVTAILVLANDDLQANQLARKINEGLEAQAASPIVVVRNFFSEIVGQVQLLVLVLAVLIVVVAGIGVMVSIYNSMNERKHEIAVMRSLGAGRGTVRSIILLESILLSLGGGVVGFLLGHGLIAVLNPLIVAKTGVSIGFFHFDVLELILIPGLVIIASFAGYLPAATAYNTDVAKALSSSP